jgi:pyochelin biosynthetic protein PchC
MTDARPVAPTGERPTPPEPERWLRRFRPVADPRLRLVCFPHAGGAASAFHGWAARLPADIELLAVRYPGRQDRIAEPCATHMDQLAGPVAAALATMTGVPLALFGHSMGAAAAYEVTRRLEASANGGAAAGDAAAAAAPVVRLFASGRSAPRLGRGEPPRRPGDEGLIDEIHRLGGFDPEIFDSPGMRELIMPAIRGDYEILDSYGTDPDGTVRAPIVAYVGSADPDISAEDAQAWSHSTVDSFRLRVFDGDHFYLVPGEAELVADIVSYL